MTERASSARLALALCLCACGSSVESGPPSDGGINNPNPSGGDAAQKGDSMTTPRDGSTMSPGDGPPATGTTITVVVVGDIAGSFSEDSDTAELAEMINPDHVLT